MFSSTFYAFEILSPRNNKYRAQSPIIIKPARIRITRITSAQYFTLNNCFAVFRIFNKIRLRTRMILRKRNSPLHARVVSKFYLSEYLWRSVWNAVISLQTRPILRVFAMVILKSFAENSTRRKIVVTFCRTIIVCSPNHLFWSSNWKRFAKLSFTRSTKKITLKCLCFYCSPSFVYNLCIFMKHGLFKRAFMKNLTFRTETFFFQLKTLNRTTFVVLFE